MVDEERALLRVRGRVAFSLAMIAIGGLILLVRREFIESLRLPAFTTLAVGVAVLLQGIALLLISYLRGDFVYALTISGVRKRHDTGLSPVGSGDVESQLRKLRDDVESMKASVAATAHATAALSESDKSALLDALQKQIQSVSAEDVVKQLEAKYASQLIEQTQLARVRDILNTMAVRLRQEIEVLSRRGNLNLVIGTVTTALAVAILAYMVLEQTAGLTDLPSILTHYIPRISTGVFIEVFSFFFLRLYRAGLADIKYFQNELTNIELRAIALEAALANGTERSREMVTEILARTDRNLWDRGLTTSTRRGKGKDGSWELPELVERLIKIIVERETKVS